MELLEAEVFTIEAIEIQLAQDVELTTSQRDTLLLLQAGYEFRRDQLPTAIAAHE